MPTSKTYDNLSKAGLWLGVILPLWGGIGYLVSYDRNLMKKSDYNMEEFVNKTDYQATIKALQINHGSEDLDARIERTDILIAVYGLHKHQLSAKEADDYEAAKNRKHALIAQRDLTVRPAE